MFRSLIREIIFVKQRLFRYKLSFSSVKPLCFQLLFFSMIIFQIYETLKIIITESIPFTIVYSAFDFYYVAYSFFYVASQLSPLSAYSVGVHP